ncbi:hypothetical protein PG985_011404 [Apiospora marii]|uniref:uncharacterized protein n=1 Tax=Apiospora marii TaxID=335849 RepID=UPI00312E351C
MGLSDVLGRFASKLRSGNAGADGDDDEPLVIGIDFGTTSSGVGWATAADITSDQINIITSWPGSGREEGKVPTELFYERRKTTWGFEVGNDCDPVRWFKLLLLKEEDLAPDLRSSEFLLRARQHMRDEGKTAVQLVADYLRALWAHILESITKSRGEVVVDISRFRVVITIPAIWKPYARQAMRDAVEKAGILKKRMLAGPTSLSFVSEPEAAALSTLSETGRYPKKDDVYLICDGGGGTVDLITYKILETGPLALEEAVEGSGGLCGAIFIDQAFQRKVKKALGRKWDRLSKVDMNELMNNSWEYGPKHQFSLSHDMNYVISIPSAAFVRESDRNDDQCDPPIKDGRMVLKKKHVKAIFDEVMTEIDVLVDSQIAAAKRKDSRVTSIILVGGLGSSPYLYEHLRDRHKKSKISVLQSGEHLPGPSPFLFSFWLDSAILLYQRLTPFLYDPSRIAICRGAVLSGFLQEQADKPPSYVEAVPIPVKVVSTIARASYGSVFMRPYDPALDRQEDVVWKDREEAWYRESLMHWYINRGDNVTKVQPVKRGFSRLVDPAYFSGSFNVDLLQCEAPAPPGVRDSRVKTLCTIKCKIATPVSSLPDFVNSKGQKFKKVEYVIHMVPSGASVEFAVWAGGKKLGSSEAQIRFE